ncbi:retrovirus-related pol polyprotein from transposon TNT 1-94 [Tanacetum coccineum]|uniref:Retrovirus-related pol polyprotein from transposon TNT 1-94 n=1 Tax=Tanacetum coccineum TaxID=301880 RepID=A0ABQ5EM01_9ASTR
MGLWYSNDTDMSLTAYSDANHAGCQDTRRSTSGSAQFLGDKLVSWSSKKQKSTAISSTEAKYIALSGVTIATRKIQLLDRKAWYAKHVFKNGKTSDRGRRRVMVIFPRQPNQDFVEPSFEDEMVSFIKDLGYIGKCDMLSEIHTDHMHQPWRTFAAKNVDYVALLWEDFMFQADNIDISPTRKEHMPYPRFIKIIIDHFISKDKTISMRYMINLHTVRDDTLLGTLKFVSKTEDYQKYGALIPDEIINQDIKDSKAYKTYFDFATGKATPKKASKLKKIASSSKKLSHVLEEEHTKKPKRARKPTKKSTTVLTAGVVIRDTPGVSVSKKKAPTMVDKGKGMDLLSNAALLEVAQLKEAFKKSKYDSHILHASGSGDGVGSQPKVPDELKDKTTSTNKGTGTKPGVPDVTKVQYESENKSWGDSGDDDSNNDEINDDDDDDVDSDADCDNEASDSEKTDSDKDENPNLNQNDNEEEETQDDEYEHTPDYYVPTDEETNDEYKEFNEEEYEELYKDVNVRLKDEEHEKEGKADAEMKNAGRDDVSREISYEQVEDDANVTLTATQKTKGPMQSSSISSDFASQFLNLDNISPADNEVVSMMNVKVRHEESSTQVPSLLTVPVTVIPKTSTVAATTVPLEISDFATPVIQSTIIELLENVVWAKSSSQPQSTYEVAASLTEFELKNILLDKLQKSKSYRGAKEHRDFYDALVKSYQLHKDLFESYSKAYSLKRDREDKDKDKEPPAGLDQWLKKRKMSKDAEPPKGSKSKESKSSSSKGTKSQPKIICTPIDFSAYVMNNLKVDNLTQDILVGPAFNLLKGTCKSRVELEYNFKEYRGHQVVPVDYFLNKARVSDRWKIKAGNTRFYNKNQGLFYGFASHRELNHDVYSIKRIIAVTRVQVMKWLMCSDKLFKFSDGTLTSVRTVLHDIASNLRMDYLPKIRWSNLDRQRSRIVIKEIDKLQLERRLMRSLEKFIGGSDYGIDLRLLKRII